MAMVLRSLLCGVNTLFDCEVIMKFLLVLALVVWFGFCFDYSLAFWFGEDINFSGTVSLACLLLPLRCLFSYSL